MPQKSGSLIEKKHLSLEDNRNQGLFLIDGQGCIIDINRTFTDLLGYRGQDIAGRHFAQLRYNISQKGDRQDEFIGSFGLFLFTRPKSSPYRSSSATKRAMLFRCGARRCDGATATVPSSSGSA